MHYLYTDWFRRFADDGYIFHDHTADSLLDRNSILAISLFLISPLSQLLLLTITNNERFVARLESLLNIYVVRAQWRKSWWGGWRPPPPPHLHEKRQIFGNFAL
jgi:hypothetical protein